MFDMYFACLKDAAGAALKNAAPAPGLDQQKNQLQLRNTAYPEFGSALCSFRFRIQEVPDYSDPDLD